MCVRPVLLCCFTLAVVPKFGYPLHRTSRPSFKALEDMTKDPMEATGNDYRTSGRKVCIISHRPFFAPLLMFDQALARDGFRCIITGMFDSGSLKKSEAMRDMAKRDGANGVVICPCHILSESTTQGTDPTGISGGGIMAKRRR